MKADWNYQNLLDIMAWTEEFTLHFVEGGVPLDKIKRFQKTFTGNNRRFDALEAALLSHYISFHRRDFESNSNLKESDTEQNYGALLIYQSEILEKQVTIATDSRDVSFFRDFTFFLANPLRGYSQLKRWLVEIHFLENGTLFESHQKRKIGPYFVKESRLMWGSPQKSKTPPAGTQLQHLTGSELVRLYEQQFGKYLSESQIYRACRELGIRLKHPRKLMRTQNKRTQK